MSNVLLFIQENNTKMASVSRIELVHAQIALFVAIILQFVTLRISNDLLPSSQYMLIVGELILSALLGFTHSLHKTRLKTIHHVVATLVLGLISIANITALFSVLTSLVVGHVSADGPQLLASALAIFGTNIIVFSLWYWEIDSPGLTGKRWSKHDKDFQFTQQDLPREYPNWRPEFLDYFFLSVISAINFAPADTRPLTRQAKMLMAAQSLISVFTLALVLARSVSVLGP